LPPGFRPGGRISVSGAIMLPLEATAALIQSVPPGCKRGPPLLRRMPETCSLRPRHFRGCGRGNREKRAPASECGSAMACG
jgi:hypothetical protein